MTSTESSPGFFGKVTSHGDFVSRRLPSTFVEAWDTWLQASVLASREKLGQSWQSSYLTSPIWRFALNAEVVDDKAWAGVLMPSVDRVGRYFPLTIGASTGNVTPLACLLNEKKWFDDLEALALSSLDVKFQLEPFDVALQNVSGLTAQTDITHIISKFQNSWHLEVNDLENLHAKSESITNAIAGALLSGHSQWWTHGSNNVSPCLIVCRGLPNSELFSAMLDGNYVRPSTK